MMRFLLEGIAAGGPLEVDIRKYETLCHQSLYLLYCAPPGLLFVAHRLR